MQSSFLLATVLVCWTAATVADPMVCRDVSTKAYTALDLVLDNLDNDVIVAQAKVHKIKRDNTVGLQIKKVWGKYNGGLKRKVKVPVSPTGEDSACGRLIKKKTYFVFLREISETGTYEFVGKPERKKPKEWKRVMKEVLCSKCKLFAPELKPNRKKTAAVLSWKNESLSLVCQAKGRPYPKFNWYKGQTPIKKSDQVIIDSGKDSSSLTITGGPMLDTDTYRCVAFNHLGNQTQTTLVTFAQCKVHCDVPDGDGLCVNGGICCVNRPSSSGGEEFCVCPPQWSGGRCELIAGRGLTED